MGVGLSASVPASVPYADVHAARQSLTPPPPTPLDQLGVTVGVGLSASVPCTNVHAATQSLTPPPAGWDQLGVTVAVPCADGFVSRQSVTPPVQTGSSLECIELSDLFHNIIFGNVFV